MNETRTQVTSAAFPKTGEATITEEIQPRTSIDRVINEGGKFIIQAIPTTDRYLNWTVCGAHVPGYRHSACASRACRSCLLRSQAVGSAGVSQQWAWGNLGEHNHNWWASSSSEQCDRVPDEAVIYNSEHAGSHFFNEMKITLRCCVAPSCGITHRQCAQLTEKLGRPVLHVPLGDVPQFTRIPSRLSSDEDIDVQFFGSSAPRRTRKFDEIRSRGLVFDHAFGGLWFRRDV